jgi:hypothetical protein
VRSTAAQLDGGLGDRPRQIATGGNLDRRISRPHASLAGRGSPYNARTKAAQQNFHAHIRRIVNNHEDPVDILVLSHFAKLAAQTSSRDPRGISIRRLAAESKTRQASGCRPHRQKSRIAQAKPVVVIYERDAPFPVPQDEVDSVGGSAASIARNDNTDIALRNRGLGQVLRRHGLS